MGRRWRRGRGTPCAHLDRFPVFNELFARATRDPPIGAAPAEAAADRRGCLAPPFAAGVASGDLRADPDPQTAVDADTSLLRGFTLPPHLCEHERARAAAQLGRLVGGRDRRQATGGGGGGGHPSGQPIAAPKSVRQ